MGNIQEIGAVRAFLSINYPGDWGSLLIRVSSPENASSGESSIGKRPIDPAWCATALARYESRTGAIQNIETMADHICKGGNVGLAVPQGIVVLDADSEADFEKLRAAVPANTPIQRSARGGHVVLRVPSLGKIKNSVRIDCAGIKLDVRAEGAMFVAAPSTHRSGIAYEWESPLPSSLEDIPPCPVELEKSIVAAATTERPRRTRAQ